MNQPVVWVNWASLVMGVLAVAGACLLKDPIVSKKLSKVAAASGTIYLLTIGLMMFLDLLANPLIRFSIGGLLAVLGALMIRMFWKKGFGGSRDGNL
jgi:hypothetical protein